MKPRSIIAFTFLACALAFAFETNAQVEKQTKAFLVDSLGRTANGDFKGRTDLFISEVKQYPGSRALIILYGPPREIEARKRLINEHFQFRRFPMAELDVKIGGNVSEFRSDAWIIPAGADPPDIKPEAWIFRDIGRAYKADVTRGMADLDKEARKLGDHQLYIINYGTPAQVAQRERWLRDAIPFRRFDGEILA